jgi:PIN domain nuclease of toxin-antitoxin system
VERIEVTYLDTHVVVWLYRGDAGRLSEAARARVDADDLLVSPAAILELEYLNEIERLKPPAMTVIRALSQEIGIQVCELPFLTIVSQALKEKWVRDPFDRLIVAHARAKDAQLITKDERIQRHYSRAVW